MNKAEVKELLRKYNTNNCSPEERELVERWYFHESLLQQLPDGLDSEDILQRKSRSLNVLQQHETNKPVSWKWIKVAAIITIAAAAGLLTFIKRYQLQDWIAPVRYTTVETRRGEIKKLVLPDSSVVWLNAGSRFSYPDAFRDHQPRRVSLLNGQAFMEIVHKEAQPFMVTSGEMRVQVLGTSFEVKSFANERKAIVSVMSGKVGVMTSGKRAAVLLLPQEELVLNKANHQLEKHTVDRSDIAAWRDNRMIFVAQPLSEVFPALERQYNTKIIVNNDKLLAETVTMRLNSQPLTRVLDILAFSNHFTYRKINEQLIVVK